MGALVEIRDNPVLSQCIADDFLAALQANGWFGVSELTGNQACR